jgi:hypothetical protein
MTNYNGDDLEQASRSKTANFTVRRLRDDCDTIVLD